MKRYRYRTEKLFHITLWCIILLLSLNVFAKCIRIFGLESDNGYSNTFGTKVVSSACNYILQSRISIADYISNSGQDEGNNLILNTMLGTFPINQYIAAASINTNNNLIDDQKDTFSYAYDLMFNNDLYVKLILSGIENSKTINTETASGNDNSGEADTSPGSKQAMSANVLKGLMPINIISGEVYLEDEGSSNIDESAETLGTINGEHFTLNQLLNRQFLYNNFYIVDSTTETDDDIFDAKKLLSEDMSIKTASDKPQILIYHTHSQEAYSDSQSGKEGDTVVGLGTHLTKLLEEKYGYNVIHDTTKYDILGGTLDRNLAYNYARDGIEKILKENPSIEVVIDIHRDGADSKRVAKVSGKDTAKIMLFNGLSRNSKGEIAYLKNPYIQDNLAFSLQVQLQGREKYPGLMYKNYLKAYRYNMHERKKTLLAEVGTNKNTIEEAMNSMDYLADILNDVFKGETKLTN